MYCVEIEVILFILFLFLKEMDETDGIEAIYTTNEMIGMKRLNEMIEWNK